MSNSDNSSVFVKACLVVGIASLFYLYEFFLRVSPSSMTHELMRDFSVSASSIGTMSGFFFFAYAPMQIPVGLLCDRYGPKIWLTLAVLCCGTAALVFSYTSSVYVASIARFFIGLASAFAFVGPLVMASHWFEVRQLATVAALIQVVGCLGAVFAGGPISQLIEIVGWRATLMYSGLAGFILALVFLLFLQNQPNKKKKIKVEAKPLLLQIKEISQNPNTWWIAIVAFACWAPISIFAELWGTSFIMTAYHASKIAANNATVFIWIGIAFGSLIASLWSNKIKKRKQPIMILNIIGFFASILVIFCHVNDLKVLDVFLFFLGFAAGIQPLTFGLVCENNHKENHGAAMGVNNMAVIMGGVFLQPLVGMLLDLFWDKQMFDGAPLYQLDHYQYAFIVIPIFYILSMLVTHYKIKETHCEPQK